MLCSPHFPYVDTVKEIKETNQERSGKDPIRQKLNNSPFTMQSPEFFVAPPCVLHFPHIFPNRGSLAFSLLINAKRISAIDSLKRPTTQKNATSYKNDRSIADFSHSSNREMWRGVRYALPRWGNYVQAQSRRLLERSPAAR